MNFLIRVKLFWHIPVKNLKITWAGMQMCKQKHSRHTREFVLFICDKSTCRVISFTSVSGWIKPFVLFFFFLLYFALIPISILSHSNKTFSLCNTEVYRRDSTSRLNNEGRQNENFMMKFTPKKHIQSKGKERLTFECRTLFELQLGVGCLLADRLGWTRNLSDVCSTTLLIPN